MNIFREFIFDFKEFLDISIEKYFPNVNWRWVGSGFFAHLYICEIILFLLEYGYWTV